MEVVRNANQVTHKITPFTKSISLKYLKVNRKFEEMPPFPGGVFSKRKFCLIVVQLLKVLLLLVFMLLLLVALRGLMTTASGEIYILSRHIWGCPLVSLSVRPFLDLQTAYNHDGITLVEIPGNQLPRPTPRCNGNPVGFPLSGLLVLYVPVNRQGEGADGNSALGMPDLWVSGQAAHDKNLIEQCSHLISNFSQTLG